MGTIQPVKVALLKNEPLLKQFRYKKKKKNEPLLPLDEQDFQIFSLMTDMVNSGY